MQWGFGSKSEVLSFTTGSGGVFPAAPNQISPGNEEPLPDTNVVLQWEPIPDANYYQVWVGEYYHDWGWQWIRFTTPGTSLDLSWWVFPNTDYLWDLRALNDYAWGDWSETWSFRTGSDARGTLSRSDEVFDYDIFIETETGERVPVNECIKNMP